MAKKRPTNRSVPPDAQASESAAAPPSDSSALVETSDGHQITPQVARELAEWRLRLMPNVVAARVWNDVFNDDDRARLGGDLQAAWRGEGQGTMAMYMRARYVTYERAMLEIAWGLGQIHQADYDRLLQAIGGREAGRLHPIWDPDRLRLLVGGQVVRTIRGRNLAKNICQILDSFEELGWPGRIDDPLPGLRDSQRLREAVRSLNAGLSVIQFAADGTGRGVTWNFG